MAAIAYPSAPFVWQRSEPWSSGAPTGARLRALPDLGEREAPLHARERVGAVIALRPRPDARPLHRVRRSFLHQLALWAAPVALLVGVYAGASAIASSGGTHYSVLPGSVRSGAGYRYTVAPGDTLWSIATRLDPSGDPRVLVTSLENQVPGGVVHPGESLLVP